MTEQHRPTLWPTTPLQQGLLALADMSDDHETYLGQAVVHIDGPLDVASLERAVTAVLTRQPHLHAGFLLPENGAPVQFIDAGQTPVFRLHECSVEEVLRGQRREQWDLAEPPLIRWDLCRVESGAALVVAAHHTILDGWSMPLLVAEVAREYAVATGASSDIEPNHADYGAHLNHVTSRDETAAQAFWAKHLADLADEPTPGKDAVPVDGPRSLARIEMRLERPHRGAGGEKVTDAALARTCWGLALDAVTGSRGTPFAVTVSTRSPDMPGSADAIGLATEAVLVSEQPDPGATVLEAAQHAQRRWLTTLPHQHVGLRGIHAALGRGELATSLLTVENDRGPAVHRVGKVTFTLTSVDDDSHYAIAPTIGVSTDGSWRVEVAHDASQVEHRHVQRLLAAFSAFVRAAGSDTTIAEVDVLSGPDRELLQVSQSRGHEKIAALTLLPDVLATVCATHPQRVALVDAGVDQRNEIRFVELAERITRRGEELLAQLPAAEGEQTEAPLVAVACTRSASTVVTMLAVLDIGATLMVLDPALPTPRRDAVLTDTGAHLLVTDEGVALITDEDVEPTTVGSIERRPYALGARRRTPKADDIAAVVLTSGSTGLPKPVAVPHRAMASLLAEHTAELHPEGVDHPRQVGHSAALHFDAHWDALLAMFLGHTVHLLADDLYLDAFALADYIDEVGLQYLDLTPTVWSALISADAFTALPDTCVLGGEALPVSLWSELTRRTEGTGTRVLNMYGPTETTVDAAWAEVTDHASPVVGGPVGACGLLVLDARLRRVPPGTPGELYITGPQLAHGYLGRSAATASRFVANPHPRMDSEGRVIPGDERMYRTGDLATWTEDGVIRLGGRSDDQLSIAGRRVEPAEIEGVIEEHPAVAQAAVTLATSRSGRGQLVAHLVPAGSSPSGVPQDGEKELEAAIRAHVAAHLPSALVPASFVMWGELPLTRNGKLDRLRLTRAGEEQGKNGGASASPTTDDVPEAFGAIRDVVAEVLGTGSDADVGDLAPDTDFFLMGGDSISAIHVASRLREHGWRLRASQVLMGRTLGRIAVLAEPVGEAVTQSASDETDPFGLLDDRTRNALAGLGDLVRVLPLTPGQLGMYIDAHRWDPDPYRTTTTLRIHDPGGALGEADVRAAVEGLFARHESLRMGIWQGHRDEPIAFIGTDTHVAFDVVDAGDRPVPALLDQIRRHERTRLYSFERAELSGCTWLRVNASESYVVLGMHHVLVDGWSTPILVAELEESLRGVAHSGAIDRGVESYLQWWNQQDHRAAEAVWHSEFDSPMPTMVGEGPVTGERAIATASPDPAALERIAAHGTTLAAAAQAAWARVLARLTGRTDVSYLLASAGRPEECPGLTDAVGMFVTTRPMRVDARRRADDLAHDVVAMAERTETAAHLGLGRIVRIVGEVADTLVVVENYPKPQAVPMASGPRVEPLSGEDATTYPLVATVLLGDTVELEVEAAVGASTVDADRVAETWARELEAVANGAEGLIDAPGAPAAAPSPKSRSAVVPAHPSQVEGPIAQVREVMAAVLGTFDVAADDSFFDAGGDSILAVALTGALRNAGLVVGIGDVFEAPTPQGLAARISLDAPAHPTSSSSDAWTTTGLFLTPALAWYREQSAKGSGQGMQQVREFRVAADTKVTTIAAAIDELVGRHDALRISLEGDEAMVVPPARGRLTVTAADELRPEALRASQSIRPAAGDLTRWIVVPEGDAVRVLAVIHHLGIDAVSWGLLENEFSRLVAGEELPPAPSFAAWTQAQRACVTAASGSLPMWRRMLEPTASLGHPESECSTSADLGVVGDCRDLELTFTPDVTQGLLDSGVRMEALLAAALTRTRREDLVIEMEGHGRPTELPAGDPRSETPHAGAVGWFTATWPVRLPGGGRPGVDAASHLVSTNAVMEMCRARGLDHGLLRYCHPVHSTEMTELERRCPPQVLINYLGTQLETDGVDAAALEISLGVHDEVPVTHPIELLAHVTRTAEGPALTVRWQVAAPLAARAEALMAAWEESLTELSGVEWGQAPIDAALPLHVAAALTGAERARIAADESVQAVWDPSPVQRGMIFHAQEDDPYTSSVRIAIGDDVDLDVLRRAMRSVMAHEPALRLRVRWVGEGPTRRPVLVTVDSTEVEWLPEEAGSPSAEELVHRRFDLERGPLLRIAVTSGFAGRRELVIANHHLLLDGWSMPLLIDALATSYLREMRGVPDRPVVPVAASAFALRDERISIACEERGAAAIERRVGLLAESAAGLVVPVLTERFGVPAQETGSTLRVVEWALDSAVVQETARRCEATVAALLAAAWGITLAAATGGEQAVTGLVLSGRDGHVEDHDLMGMFMDTAPLLVGRGSTMAELVRDVSAQTAALLAEPPVGLAPLGRALGRGEVFDALLVVENYPVPEATSGPEGDGKGLALEVLDGEDATHYPLGLTVETEGTHTRLRFETDPRVIGDELADALFEALKAVVQRLTAGGETLSTEELRHTARACLPVPEEQGHTAAPAPPETQDNTDRAVVDMAAAFAAVLDPDETPTVGEDTNFFASGGDSILAMALVTQCRDRGLQIRASDVFTHPTPRALAERAVLIPTSRRPAEHVQDREAGPIAGAPGDDPVDEFDALDAHGAAALNELLRNL